MRRKNVARAIKEFGKPKPEPPPPPPPPEPELDPDDIVYPEPIAASPPTSEAGLFDDLDDDATQMMVVTAPLPLDDIPPLDTGLTLDEKQEFVRLLNTYLTVNERARQLAKLALFTDQKRAAVGLRALQEINALTGMNKDRPGDSAPMFVLPEGTRVSIVMKKVSK